MKSHAVSVIGMTSMSGIDAKSSCKIGHDPSPRIILNLLALDPSPAHILDNQETKSYRLLTNLKKLMPHQYPGFYPLGEHVFNAAADCFNFFNAGHPIFIYNRYCT